MVKFREKSNRLIARLHLLNSKPSPDFTEPRMTWNALFDLESIFECSDISLLFDLVASDLGEATVPQTVIKRYNNRDIVACKITHRESAASASLTWLKNHYLSQTSQNFANLLTAHMND